MTTKSPSECFTAQTILGFFGTAEVNPDVGGVAVAISSMLNLYRVLYSLHANDVADIVINSALRELQSIRFRDLVLTRIHIQQSSFVGLRTMTLWRMCRRPLPCS